MEESEPTDGLIHSLNQAANEARRGVSFIGQLSAGAAPATQIDLNDETHLADLEDAGLMSHMEEARAQLMEQLKEISQLPSREAVSQADTTARRALSTIITDVAEQKMSLATVRDRVVLHASDIEKLSAGIQPYGYPSAHGTHSTPAALAADRGQLVYLCSRVSASGTDIELLWNKLHRIEVALTCARREIESALVGLERRGTYFESAWHQLCDKLQ